MRRLAMALTLLGLGAGIYAAPALAANHFIQMHAHERLPVGQPAAIYLEGVVAPPAEFWDSSWIEVVALPGSLGACPGDAGSGGLMAEQTGLIIAIALPPNADEAGNFANSVAVMPRAVGPVLICGYLYNENGYTWSAAELRLEVVDSTAAASPGGGTGSTGSGPRPVNLSPPWVTRSGRRLVCHPGKWSNVRGPFAYNWILDGRLRKVTGRRPPSPGPIGRGHRVSCRVTAYAPGGRSATATSPPLRLGCGCADRRRPHRLEYRSGPWTLP